MDEKRLEEKILSILNETLRLDGEYIDYESKENAAKEIVTYIKEQLLLHPLIPWNKTY